MSQLLSVRTNIYYVKTDETYNRYQELIFLLEKPSYRYSNEGEIIRERGLEEIRFDVSDKVFDQLLGLLVKLRDADEKELT